MCGLFGLIDYQGVLNCQQKNRIIAVLSKECEVRGSDATGIAYISQNKLKIYKKPVPAHRVQYQIPLESSVVMGHTRLTTQGNEKHNYNNHPFRGNLSDSFFALAHNGMINNDLFLKKKEHLPNTHIKTDSYVAVQLIEMQKKLSFESLSKVVEKLEGSFSFTVLDNSNNIYFIKGDSPLLIYQFKGFYLYASTEAILRKALKALKMPCSCKEVSLSYGEILKIDWKGKLTRSRFNTMLLDSQNYVYRFHPYRTSYPPLVCNEYQWNLIDYAKCCGIPQDDIELLLDLGYDENTIEDLLYNPSHFHTYMEELLCDFV